MTRLYIRYTTREAGENYTAIAMDGGEAGVHVIVATEAMEMPNTALRSPDAPIAAFGAVLVALGLAAALPMAVRRVRS